MRDLIHEIHRRSLWQVLGVYVVVSWIVLQVVDVIGNNFGLPDWVAPAALVLLLVGLPIVVGTAFVQEGVGRGPAPSDSEPQPELGPAGVDPEAATVKPATSTSPSRGAGHRVLTWRHAIA